MLNFKAVPYQKWGPWRNRWGYITEIASFDNSDIIVKTTTPNQRTLIYRFVDWESCEQMIDLLEADRRF